MQRKFIYIILLFSYLNIIASLPGYSRPGAMMHQLHAVVQDQSRITDQNNTLIEILMSDLLDCHCSDNAANDTLFHYSFFIRQNAALRGTSSSAAIIPRNYEYHSDPLKVTLDKQHIRFPFNEESLKPLYYHFLYRLKPF